MALAAAEQAEAAAAAIMDDYWRQTGRPGQAYVCSPAQGVHVL